MKSFEGIDLRGINPMWEELAEKQEKADQKEANRPSWRQREDPKLQMIGSKDKDHEETVKVMHFNSFYQKFLTEHNQRVATSLDKLELQYNDQINYQLRK